MLRNPSPENIGILGLDFYIPKKYVDQSELESYDNVSSGKYTIGLGQSKMGVCDDREDIHSISLTVVKSLMEKYNVRPDQVGRIEVGTETIIDKSKSTKSVLMQLFSNTDIEGVDTTNACYGGTNALFNCINYLESSAYDGRLAICVAADIAVYSKGNARPTGGAGAVAILLGPNAPLVFEQGVRSTHMEHVYDFYKPDLHSEYPVVDGPLSNKCYTKALDICYTRYIQKLSKFLPSPSLNNLDHVLFHCPYTKLVQKSFGRLKYNDYLRDSGAEEFVGVDPSLASMDVEKSYDDRVLQKTFVDLTKKEYQQKVLPSLLCAKNVGNMYCASLYGGLVSLLGTNDSQLRIGDRIAMFSYGSGLASSMFSLLVKSDVGEFKHHLNLPARLSARTKITPKEFEEMLQFREDIHNQKGYVPKGRVDGESFDKGVFYLNGIDEMYRRDYSIFE